MLLLVVPHLNCNLFCHYCYEGRYRKKHKTETKAYNLEIMLKRMEELKNGYSTMCLHGGEPLMLPKQDVRAILLKIKELTGKSGIQTNGTLIDDDFIKIFKECSTSVGLSCDGPGELSEYRFYKYKNIDLDKKIEKMIKEKINIGLMIVISKANAGTPQRLKKLKDWILKLDKKGISGRLNPCGYSPGYELEEKELIKVYLDLAKFCFFHNLKWSPFTDIINGLQGKSRVCTFSGCDPFCTPSATELLGDGSLTNCMRVNQDYILLRHPIKYNTRNEILSQTSQEFGGCQDCQYWHACYGGCPTMTINGDWRNRTYLCPTWKALFKFYEKALTYCGISLVKKSTEQKSSYQCENLKCQDSEHGDSHGDSEHGDWTDNDSEYQGSEHEDSYGDSEHGDSHGDSEHGDSHGDSEHGDWTDNS